jgi:hypothetical protein
MLRLTGEQSTGCRVIKASSSFAAFAPHWYCKLSSAPTKLTAFRRINSPQASARPMSSSVSPSMMSAFARLVTDADYARSRRSGSPHYGIGRAAPASAG